MSLKNSRVFRAIAFLAVSLAVVSFALRAVHKVTSGRSFETYLTGQGFVLDYWSAIVILLAGFVAGSVALVVRLRKRNKCKPQA